MPRFRSISLAMIAMLALAGTGVVSMAQPGGDGGKGGGSPGAQPGGDRPREPQGGRPDGPRQPGEGRGQGGGGVRQGMSLMNRSLRVLSAQIGDASKKEENLKLLNDLERGAASSKGASPDRALGRMEESKRAEAAMTYRRSLIQIMEKALRAETALLDGKIADAERAVQDIAKIRDESHQAMGIRDEGPEGGRGAGGER